MFSRATQADRAAPERDPLHLRIATAVMVLGLIAGGVAVVWRDMATRNGLLPAGAAGRGGVPSQALLKLPPARLTPAETGNAGLRLLSQAATACRRVSYQGVQVTEWHGVGGSLISVVNVWHQRGRQTLIQAAAMPADQAARPLRAAHAAGPDPASAAAAARRGPEGVMSMTPQLVALLAANYRAAVGGMGWVAGRPAREVVLYHRSGTVAARFWLDSATKLPLRRETFDSRSRLVTQDMFVSLKLGVPAATQLPAAGGTMPSSRPLASAQLVRLRAAGWPLPGRLPGDLTLVQADQTSTPAGPVVDLAYSDGLSVISLFLQRGHLPTAMNGWQQVAVHGQQIYTADPDQRSVAWSARGYVYTMIADAPAQSVAEAVSALPHNGKASGGFLGRMGRGFRRLASWLNPFR